MSDERLLATFLDLVRIDSPTGSEGACAAYCAGALREIGCAVRFDGSAAATGSDVGNLIAELPGTAPVTLALCAHLDTVEPGRGVEPVVIDGVVTSAGETVLGADDKAGLAAAIEAIRRIAQSDSPRPSLKAIFTVQEEVGLVGTKQLAASDADCDLCLVLDAEGEPGAIVVAAPTHYTFRAVYIGHASHAGVAPESGVSAVRMAARAIDGMELGRLDAETTANVGSIHGGGATNVVPAACELTGECRSLERERVEALRRSMDRAMKEAAQTGPGSVDIAWKREYEGFRFAQDHPLVTTVSEACRLADLTPRPYSTGGGSDTNVLVALGVPALALACGMKNVHGTQESLAVADLEATTELVVAVARLLGERT